MAWLNQAQKYPLELKIALTNARIREWYDFYNGDVYIAYSGGLDSTVGLDLVRKIYPDVPAVFCDTGQEYDSILEQVNRTENVITCHPARSFFDILEEYGYPVVSKRVCRYVNDLQNPTPNNVATRNLRLTGMTSKGQYQPSMKLSKKWHKLIEAPFKITNKCCGILKIHPTAPYEKETGRKPFVFTMADESQNRRASYAYGGGCNAFTQKDVQSRPIMFWTEQDVLKYVVDNDIQYADIYGDIIEQCGELVKTGEQRTGCKFCLFGVHLEKCGNRIQRLADIEPEAYKFAIEELGYDKVMDFLGVDWKPFVQPDMQMDLLDDKYELPVKEIVI
jgi:3'-phosphoadenosine 5'-phosphosulfate sulfotransferase (PAPS reductase)/FAD synthetase